MIDGGVTVRRVTKQKAIRKCNFGYIHETIILPCKHEVDFDAVHVRNTEKTSTFRPDEYWCPFCKRWSK